MADRFGCDLDAVERTAKDLGTVANELHNFGNRGDEFAAALRSDIIQRAIRDFEKDSSDHRDKLVKAVEALKQLLDGLVEGCRTVDAELGKGLGEMDEALSGMSESKP